MAAWRRVKRKKTKRKKRRGYARAATTTRRRRKKRVKRKSGRGRIPLAVLKSRYTKLGRIIKSRGG